MRARKRPFPEVWQRCKIKKIHISPTVFYREHKPFLETPETCDDCTCPDEVTVDCDSAGHDDDIGDRELAAVGGVGYQPELSAADLVHADPVPGMSPEPGPEAANNPKRSTYIAAPCSSRNDLFESPTVDKFRNTLLIDDTWKP